MSKGRNKRRIKPNDSFTFRDYDTGINNSGNQNEEPEDENEEEGQLQEAVTGAEEDEISDGDNEDNESTSSGDGGAPELEDAVTGAEGQNDEGGDGEEDPAVQEQVAKEIEEQVKEKIKEEVKKKVKKEVKKKVAKKAAGAGLKALMCNPYFWIAVAIILVIIIIIVVIVVIVTAPYKNVDPASGVFDTSDGITGDCFYGARFIYYDDARTSEDLEHIYDDFAKDYLEKIDEISGIDVKLSLDYDDDDIPDEIDAMVEIIVDIMDHNDEELSLEESLAKITHFGYTNLELADIKTALSEHVDTNKETLLEIADSYTGTLLTDIQLIFDTNYATLNITAPLYYVQDVLLTEDKQMISGMDGRNYVAMIYMPKVNVTLRSAQFMFYVKELAEGQEYACRVGIDLYSVNNGESTLKFSGTADETWWNMDSNMAGATADANGLNLQMTPFQSIDLENQLITQGVNIYELCMMENGIQVNQESIETMFTYSDPPVIEGQTPNTEEEYKVIDYLPTLDTTLFYVHFLSAGKFQFCEYSVDFSK